MSVTLSQIIRSLSTFRNPAKYPPARISQFTTKHWIGTKTVLYQAVSDSLSSDNHKYNVSIQFHDIEYSTDKKSANMLTTDKINGKVYYYEPPIIGSNNVEVKCICSDFVHTFSWEDDDQNALIGNPKKYKPVSPPSGRPPRNPNHVMGVCFTGDTKISLLNGTEVPIKNLVGLDEFWVYSCKPDGTIVPGRGHSCRKTISNTQVLSVTIDNGEIIKCTPNHKFMMRDGTYKEAQYLLPNDSLMSLYRDIDGGYERYDGKHPNHKVISIEFDGYEDVYDIEVDEYHNFALSAGVFVHNCKHLWSFAKFLKNSNLIQGQLV